MFYKLSGFVGTPAAMFSIIFPSIMKAIPNLTEFDQNKKFYSILINKTQKQIDKHKEVSAVKNPKDVIDHSLVEMANTHEETVVEDPEDRLRTLIIDIVTVSS
jgi:hypothetical protein